VMMSLDKDESTRKMERDAEAAAKRQQNALPAWHLKSTISGDLTALGVMEHARAEVAEANAAASSSNDDILRGLGVVGSGPTRHDHHHPVRIVGDVKPVVNHESDYYDQYYASLAASAAPSTQDTPSGLGASGSDDFGDFGDDEEDRKPSLEYLDSLNDYRKRSRSREDEGVGKKVAKVEENGYNGLANGKPKGSVLEINVPAVAMLQDATPQDDPIIYVNGAPIPLSKVTEEDHELMTPEEYTTYFEVIQTRS